MEDSKEELLKEMKDQDPYSVLMQKKNKIRFTAASIRTIVDGQFDDLEETGTSFVDPQPQSFFNYGSSRCTSTNGQDGFRREELPVDGDDDWSCSEEDYSDDYLYEERSGPNSQSHQKTLQTSDELFRKVSSKVNVEKFEGIDSLPTGVGNKILSTTKRAMAQGTKVKDKQDRATVEQVLDPRTRMILYKLLSTGKVLSIDGCISTGKEANVYHATGPENSALAIKIYKTSILTFKARDKYVSGEFRFRQGYSKSNPRKMVRLWAEKEYRNLLRIHTTGLLNVPQPRILKSHVLVMDFIGENGWPCPLLKDVKFSELDLPGDDDPVTQLISNLYRQCLLILYRLFKHCKLVHADFSEFNLILKDLKDLYVIDVSQSVEHDHPRSFDFLRHDIKNVQDFFGKYIHVGDFKEIFEFITSPTVDDSNYEAKLENILGNRKPLESFNVAEEVFKQTHIPRKMEEIIDYERDYDKMKKGEKELVYTSVMGMKPDMSGPVGNDQSVKEDEKENILGGPTISESEGDDGSETDSEGDDKDDKTKDTGSRPKNETAEERKLRKKQVKEDKAEKRKTKVKKHVKKRKEKMAHANSKR